MNRLSLAVGVSVSALVALPASARAQTAGVIADANIPGRPTPNIGTAYNDLSGDGITIAGVLRVDATTHNAYRITASGYEALPGVDGHNYVIAWGVSDNGSVIVGYSAAGSSTRGTAVLWEGATRTTLGHLATTTAFQNSVAYAVSGDGTVAVGASVTDTAALHAVRWVSKGAPQDIQSSGFSASSARSVSRDGSVIVGEAHGAVLANEAFVWTAADGMIGLGVLPADVGKSFAGSFATDVSADGTTVVGYSKGGNGDYAQAFKWTRQGGLSALNLLPSGQDGKALGVNADGSVIVGSATSPSPAVPTIQGVSAVRWTAGGVQQVADWLTANGVSVGSNTFTDAVAVSDDGNVLIGTGQINGTTQEYIARVVPASTGGGNTGGNTGGDTGGGTGTGTGTGGNTGGGSGTDTGGNTGNTGGTGFIGMVDYLYSVSQSGGVTFQNIINAANVTLFGAHHRPLMDAVRQQGSCAWLTGDFAGSGRNDRRNYSGEAGLCHDFGDSVRIGFGGGADRTELTTGLGGKTVSDGYHLVGEIDVKPAGTPILLSVLGYYGDWNVTIDRAYLNGAVIDHSTGRTNARSWAVRGRLDWQDAVRFNARSSLSPYLAYTHLRTTMDGYVEAGGGFPMALGRVAANLDETRLGAVAKAGVTDKVKLQASGEWVHRFDRAQAALSGTIIGAATFAAVAPSRREDWGRLGLDLDIGLGKRAILNFSGHAMIGHGEDARMSGSVGLRYAF